MCKINVEYVLDILLNFEMILNNLWNEYFVISFQMFKGNGY